MNPPATPPETPDDQPTPPKKPRPSRKQLGARPAPTLQAVLDPASKPVRYAEEGKRKRPPRREIDGKISDVVKDARLLNRLTQVELAEAAGISLYVYVRLESGRVAWLAGQVVAVAKALKVQPADLLVAAGLSLEPGGLPEDSIGRDRRLQPFQRDLAVQYYRQLLAQNDPSGSN